jgi:hypothetical protein
MSLMVSWAQVEAKYGKGSVPVVNGRVMFQDTIHTTLAPEVAYGKVLTWAKKRFQKPNVIISKFVSNDIQNQQLNVTAEEYLVFTNRFFVFDRTRINYWVDIKCHQGYTVLTITRINYWYEEERNGGLRFNAEEMITDKEAFNKKGTKLLKDQGKFRRKTIDFFDQCVMQLSEALN